jgi:dTMP kinase
MAELFLYLADRTEHVHSAIIPNLAKGGIVICDRFSDSTIAYQGYGRAIDLATLNKVDDVARKGIKPDLTLILDLDVETGLRRNSLISKRDRFEMEEIAFHERVRKGYLTIARQEQERVKVVNASRQIDIVWTEVKRMIHEALRKKNI